MQSICVQNGIRCSVLDINKKARRAVVFVHGWPFNTQIFESQFSVLPEYGIRCIGMDLRGYGRSDKPWEGYDYDRLADDLCNVIQTIDCNCVTLCGFSMGAAVCIRYMARHRGFKVSKLILMGTASPVFTQRAGFAYGMSREEVDILIQNVYCDQPQTCENFVRRCFYTNPSEAFIRKFTFYGTEAANYAAIKSLESLRDEDLRQDLAKIKVSTLIMHGTHDLICPFVLAQETKNGIANSFIIPFESSGHCLFYDERDKCNAAIIDFINAP